MKSILSKIFIGIALVMVALLVVILTYTIGNIRDNYISSLISDIRKLNLTIIHSIEPLILEGKTDSTSILIKELSSINKIRITIIAADGTVLNDSEKDPRKMENHANRPEIIRARQTGTGDTIRYSHSIREGLLYDAVAVKKTDGSIVAFSRLSVPVSQIDKLISEISWGIITLTAIGLLFAFVLVFFMAKKATSPIKKLVDSARKVAEGDFSVRVFLNKRDELANLANSFNAMTQKLSQLFDQNFRQSEKLNSIFRSVRDGIMVIDESNHIVLANDYMQNTISIKETTERYYWEMITDPQFRKLIKKIQNSGQPQVKPVIIGKRNFLASGSWIEAEKQIVIILSNIDEMKKVETIKRDFIANMSHELKTPLTAIKGFVETMENDIDDENRRYLDIIKRQTDRLINIVQDILLLSEIENKESRIELSDVNVGKVFSDTMILLNPKLESKKLEIKKEIPLECSIIKSDEYLMEHLFINLIDNAINYTEKGFIGFKCYTLNEETVLEFSDSGAGIPESQLDRIFERFYTIDKSRAKAFSGTGLGLAIVKHIVLLHGGTITCESAVGIGTTFRIVLPQELIN
jgi:two-component system, OmpR family, phosphate regulon sensor histidine kinase PhoR